MRINYLSAEARLSKTFEEVAPGTYKETSYPHTSRFTSVERNVDSIHEFYETTLAASSESMCLLKGILDRQLNSESRAGHTDASLATEWLCLDVDFTVTDLTQDEFIESLDPAFKNVSYVFQYSASQGIKTHKGWRGHFFFLLDKPVSPQILKQWLISKNFRVSFLNQRLGLTASGGALSYPLDITTCQNDKLIYIAPPNCLNFDDPIEDRFSFRQKKHDFVPLDLSRVSAAKNSSAQKDKIAALRVSAELPEKKFKTTQHQGWEILVNPDPVTVTDKKEARGFVYLNLNGGDSWAYYFPESNPDILYNFKGEPCMYMWDVDKEIYNEYASKPQQIEGAVPFGFLWPDDDQYYRGFANPETGELVWLKPTGSKAKLKDFFVQHGVHPPTGWAVDEWQLEFDPTRSGYADFHQRRVNTYKKSEAIREAKKNNEPVPSTIEKVITSVCVDEETKEHFLNWLACIFQTREKTNTAWIFQGVQGTGKGVLFTHVLAPLFGRAYCHEMTMDRLDDDFNAYLAENILLFIDEAKISDSRNGDRLLNRIKNLITEPVQHIRGMRANAVIRPNYSNIILASNYDDIIPLDATDRRFNVAPRQEEPIQLEYENIVRISEELSDFANFLHSFSISQERARKVLITDARARLIALSETTVDSFFLAIRNGDLSYFAQYLDNEIKSDIEGVRYHDFAQVLKRWMAHANSECNVSRNELRICYQFLQNTSISTTKFSRMVAKYNIDIAPVRIKDSVTRGIRGMIWAISEEDLELYKAQDTPNVIDFSERKSSGGNPAN